MKVFLSHMMSGLAEEDVMKIRRDAECYLREKYGDIEIIDNYHHKNVPEDAGRLWHLGASIQQLEQADAIYFCEGFTNTNGCEVESLICKLYDLKVIN